MVRRSARARVRSPRRRAAAIAAEAPTRPPITNERARPRRSSPSMGRLYEVLIATIGDLMLDVIVRLEQPLAAGDDVRARTRTGAGGQAANVAAWAASLGADARCIAKRGADATGQLVAGELADTRRRAGRTGRRGCDGSRRLRRRRGRRPLDGVGPRRRADLRTGRARSGVARLRRAPRLRLRAAARADRRDRAACGADSRASAARACPSTSPPGRRSAHSDR